MPVMKFNHLTKEIEMTGSESFIESNFNEIRNLLDESIGVKKNMESRKRMKEFQAGGAIKRQELSESSPMSPATKSSVPEISQELKPKRPPVRKYIRKEGTPGHQRITVEVVEQKPREVSIASLKEKFGLSESKIGGIMRDAEKLGKIRKAQNGSYVWMQD